MGRADGGDLSASCTDRFTPDEGILGINLIGGFVDPRAGLDAVANRRKSLPMPGIELRSSIP
jgi:hypothetical protein